MSFLLPLGFFLLLGLPLTGLAAAVPLGEVSSLTEPLVSTLKPIETKSWEEADKKIPTVRFGSDNSAMSFAFQDEDRTAPGVGYLPNRGKNYFVTASVGDISVGLLVPSLDGDSDRKGKTVSTESQIRIHRPNYSLEFLYENYRGMYLANSQDFGAKNGEYILAPNLKLQHLGGSFIWNFNPDQFSMAANFDFTDRQTQSGWSWIGVVGANTFRFSNSESLVPATDGIRNGTYGEARAGEYTAVSVGGGVAGSWVFRKNWSLAALLTVNLAAGRTRIERTSDDSTSDAGYGKSASKLTLGYNGPKYLYGYSVHADAITFGAGNARGTILVLNEALFFGMHF